MNRWKILLSVVFLHFGSLLQGQIMEGKIPLAQVLALLESRYHCQFNYAVETVDNIYLLVPPEHRSLKKTMDYLEIQTGLKFTVLSNNFISIETQRAFLICGYIKDGMTGEPIVSATIQSGTSSSISGESGYFELKRGNRKEEIRVRHLGFKTESLRAGFFDHGNCADIYLDQKEEELSEIIITDYLTEGIYKMNDGSFHINFSDFGILPGLIEADVLQTVQALPGVQSINETVSDINIRGGTNDQNLLVWDGIKMYQSGHFFGLISIFNPMITKRAVLVKNGSRVDYTDGVSGTIEMGTDANVNSEFKGGLGLNFISADGFVDVPLGKRSSLQVTARNSLSNFVETPTYNSYIERILQDTEVKEDMGIGSGSDLEYDFHDTGLRWLWHINNKNRIRINFINVRDELGFKQKNILDTFQETQSSTLFQNSLAVGFLYERNWNGSFETVLQIYGTDYKLKGENSNTVGDQRFLQENRVSETGIKLNTLYTLNDRLKLLNGYQFTETQISNLDFVNSPLFRLKVLEVLRTHGVYSQLDFSSKNLRSKFNTGIRMDYIDKFNKYLVEPRISFNQKFLNRYTVEVLGEYKHQVTSQVINFQNDFLGIEKRRWQLANDADIPIIKSKQVSLGLHYDNKGWLISGEVYYKKVSGITSQSQGFQNQFEFIKAVGGYEAYGFDYLVRKKWDDFGTWLSYSFMENHYDFETLSEGSFPNNLEIYNSMTYGMSYELDDFKVSAGFNWHTGRPTTRPVKGNEIIGQRINYGPANSGQLDEYFRIDLSSTYQFALHNGVNANLGISVWNILDHKNSISNYYRLDNTGFPVEETKTALRITPNISFRVSF